MLKFFSEAHKSLFMFLQHVTSVCLNKPGVDIALAQEGSVGSPGAGLVPNLCRCWDYFRDISRLEMLSCILAAGAAPGDGQARPWGSSASCRRLGWSICMARAWTQPRSSLSWGHSTTFQLLYLHWCFTSWKTNNKLNIDLAGISLQNPFVSQEHTCHELQQMQCSQYPGMEN